MNVIGYQLDDVLDLAILMETNGVDFYELAARNVAEMGPRLLLNGLANMEREHRVAIIAMKERLAGNADPVDADVDAAITSLLASGLKGEVFDGDMAAALAVARTGTCSDVLGMAVQMEKDSVTFYTGLRQCIADDEAENVLNQIIRDEQRHVDDLSSARREHQA